MQSCCGAIFYINCAGNDTIERLATFGMQANFVVYLMKVYNMDQVLSANILNAWLAVSNITPLIGAFIADAYLGKFLTITLASFASLVVPFTFIWIDYNLYPMLFISYV